MTAVCRASRAHAYVYPVGALSRRSLLISLATKQAKGVVLPRKEGISMTPLVWLWSTLVSVLISGCVAPAAQRHYDASALYEQQSLQALQQSNECANRQDYACALYWLNVSEAMQRSAAQHRLEGKAIQRQFSEALRQMGDSMSRQKAAQEREAEEFRRRSKIRQMEHDIRQLKQQQRGY